MAARDSGLDLTALPADQRELILDVGQLTLDIIGIFEPTPFADLTNSVISLARGQLGNALLSGIGVVPYVGDLAKLGKVPAHVRSVERAVWIARTDARFAALLQPILVRLLAAIERLPTPIAATGGSRGARPAARVDCGFRPCGLPGTDAR